jgi:hypothetical protein
MGDPNRQRLTLDDATVRGLLQAGGWPCDRIGPDTWRSHFRGKCTSFPFFVKVGEGDGTGEGSGYVTFAIVPFMKSPEDPERAGALYKRLLELNQHVLMAKFSIDDDLDVVLSVEYPLADLDKSEFADALDVLGYYADRHYDELKLLVG